MKSHPSTILIVTLFLSILSIQTTSNAQWGFSRSQLPKPIKNSPFDPRRPPKDLGNFIRRGPQTSSNLPMLNSSQQRYIYTITANGQIIQETINGRSKSQRVVGRARLIHVGLNQHPYWVDPSGRAGRREAPARYRKRKQAKIDARTGNVYDASSNAFITTLEPKYSSRDNFGNRKAFFRYGHDWVYADPSYFGQSTGLAPVNRNNRIGRTRR